MKNVILTLVLVSLTSCSGFAQKKQDVPSVQDASWACENSKLKGYEVNGPQGRFKMSCKDDAE